MKSKDLPFLKQKVLDSLPITQVEVTKMLGIDHRYVSQIIGIMVKENLIKKTKADRTFLLEKYGSNGHEKKKKKDFKILLINDKFSPCCACEIDCKPEYCQKLDEWIKGCLKEKIKKEDKDQNKGENNEEIKNEITNEEILD